MYEVGDFVVKANTGVCKVVNISNPNILGIDRSKMYYQLMPVDNDKAKVYVPIENAYSTIRKIITVEEAMKLIEQIDEIEIIKVANDKVRQQKYKEMLKTGNPKELIQIIKTTYLRKKERLEQGKKNTASDESYLKLAEKQLFSELSVVLNKDNEEIHRLIMMAVNKNKES